MWQAYYAYATTVPGFLLATDLTGRHGKCQPVNVYNIYNYYCLSQPPIVEGGLVAGDPADLPPPCGAVSRNADLITCDCVEAFIDTRLLVPGTFLPVFYRCYWNSPTPTTTYETVEFEWSATSEYIEWYVANIAIPNLANYVPNLITAAGGTPPTIEGFLVPLLKVTNHSPSLF